MSIALLLAWWNLIYIVPFAVALFYLGLFVFTGITFGEVDADPDLDADTTLHIEAHVTDVDVDADADLDADHDVDADHDAETGPGSSALMHTPAGAGAALLPPATAAPHADPTGHASPFFAFLSLLGVGKIPLSLALMILLLSWGVVGFALNALLSNVIGANAFVAIISIPLTLIISLTVTGLCALAIAKVIPNDDGTRQRRQDLVGKAGEAIFDIDAIFGMASVRGDAGDRFQVPCRTASGKPRIPKGTRIVLFDYDREHGVFQVAPFDA